MAEAKTPYRPQTTPLVRPGVQMVEDRAQEYDTRGHAASGDPAAAIASFSRAIHLLPDEPTFYWHRAEAYLKVLDFESAIANFRQHGVLVNTLRTTTAWERSLLVRPLTADSGSFDYPYGSFYVMQRRLAPVVYTWGQCLLDRKRFQEALKMFEYAASLGMKMESILLRCVLANIGLGLYETALEILYKLTEGTSDNIELFILRAKIYKHLGNVESTHLDVQRSIKINPDHPELPELLKFTLTTAIQYKNRASYQMLQGSPNVAIQYLTYAMDLDPDDWMLYLKRGALLADIAQYDCAIQDLEKVLQLPDLSATTVQEVRDKLARIHVQIGLEAYHHYDLVGAVHSFTTALDYQPQDPGTWKKRGDCYLALRNLPNSIADFAKAVELNPDDIKCRERCALLWATIADKLLADGEWTLSIEIWTTAINYNSTVAEYYFRRGRAFYMKECIDEARRDLYLARQLDPDNIEISAMLSQLTSGPPLLNTTPFPAQRIVKQSIPVALIPANEPGLVGKSITGQVPPSLPPFSSIGESQDHVLSLPPLSLPKLSVKEGGPKALERPSGAFAPGHALSSKPKAGSNPPSRSHSDRRVPDIELAALAARLLI